MLTGAAHARRTLKPGPHAVGLAARLVEPWHSVFCQQIVRLRFGSSSCCPVINPPPGSGLHDRRCKYGNKSSTPPQRFLLSLVINSRRVPPPFSAPFFLLDLKEVHVSSRLSTRREENKTKRILEQAHSGWADSTVIRWSTKQPYTRENIAVSSARFRANETRPRLAAW